MYKTFFPGSLEFQKINIFYFTYYFTSFIHDEEIAKSRFLGE